MSQNITMGWGLIEADQVWRKGPWTAEEDKLLVEYVKLHGEGRWNNVARLAGLKRNGKSCRLRWVNYLRPDLKRGQITPHEESIIIELHARWGNRWSTIARSLPGRTDNEIKNYWRTHFKKKGTKPSSTQNPEKSRARLLRRQQFQQLQKQINHHHHHQQDQIDMKKIMSSLFEESEDDKSPTSFTQLRQEIGYCYPNMLDDQAGYFYSTVVNGSCGTAPPEAVSNEDMIIWGDGFMWNMDLPAASCFY